MIFLANLNEFLMKNIIIFFLSFYYNMSNESILQSYYYIESMIFSFTF
jgi:hypothetical protein